MGTALVGIGTLSGSIPFIPNISVPSAHAAVNNEVGKDRVEGETLASFTKARQLESDGMFADAQRFYEEVIEAEPEFIYAWSNLGNVLISEGNLEQGLLCYKKALSLGPPKDQLAIIIMNKASVEMSLGSTEQALRDLGYAERLSGPTQIITTNKAVALTQAGKWKEGCDLFESVFSSAEKNALPWWLRFSMSLLETDRGTEAVAYLQRTLNRFPYESEAKAYASALYTALGTPKEAGRYWRDMKPAERQEYLQKGFVEDKLKWGPKATTAFQKFLNTKYAVITVVTEPVAVVE